MIAPMAPERIRQLMATARPYPEADAAEARAKRVLGYLVRRRLLGKGSAT